MSTEFPLLLVRKHKVLNFIVNLFPEKLKNSNYLWVGKSFKTQNYTDVHPVCYFQFQKTVNLNLWKVMHMLLIGEFLIKGNIDF